MNSDDRFDHLLQIYGDRYGVPWKLLKAQIKVESDFVEDAMSPAGAAGLAQFRPATFDEWSENLKIVDPSPFKAEHALQCQAAYMDWLIRETGKGETALAAYNWGIGNVRKCLAAYGDKWIEHLPDETKAYIKKIQRLFAAYSEVK